MPRDWAKFVAETTLETATRVFGGELKPDLAKKIQEVVAVELDKLAHRYMGRNSLVAPDNVAYHLTTISSQLHNWGPKWCVRYTKPGDAEPTVHELGPREDAYHEMLLLHKEGIKDIEVFYR